MLERFLLFDNAKRQHCSWTSIKNPFNMTRLVEQFILLAGLYLTQSTNAFTFQIARQGTVLAPGQSSISYPPKSNLFGKNRPSCPTIFMTEDASEAEEPEIQTTNELKTEKSDEVEEKRTRTLLLTIPLFCKFLVVIILKIATDLVVYPLLFLYRLAGIVKRKFLSLVGKGDGKPEKTNGES